MLDAEVRQSVSPFLLAVLAVGNAAYAAPAPQPYRTAHALGTFSDIGKKLALSEVPAAFSDSDEEMRSFKGLDAGWDGSGSASVDTKKVDGALAFLARLPADIIPPEASASGDGTVDWYWRNGPYAATVTFHSGSRAAYFVLSSAGGVKGTFDLNARELPKEMIEGLRRL